MTPIGWLTGDRFVFRTNSSLPKNPLPIGILIREPGPSAVTTWRLVPEEIQDARLSPDGTRLAYVIDSRSGGGRDLLVDAGPGPASSPVRVAHGSGMRPRWGVDGRELFFISDGHLMKVSISPGPTPTAGTPVQLFDMPSSDYAVDAARDRFLVMVPSPAPTPTVRITLNWPRQ